MCGRYTFTDTKNFERRFNTTMEGFGLNPRFNIAPGQVMPVVTGGSSTNITTQMKWGLVPFWSKDASSSYKMINARAEGIESKPSFRKPIQTQRCLVPASGFYEWQKTNRTKIPFYYRLKDADLFAFAGLYDIWRDAEGKELITYTIITTEANEIVAPVHNRMPVILKPEDEAIWLDTAQADPAKVLPLLVPYPADLMEAYPVSTRVNKPDIDDQDLLLRNSA